jgi:hypothetical protein
MEMGKVFNLFSFKRLLLFFDYFRLSSSFFSKGVEPFRSTILFGFLSNLAFFS